MTTLDIAWLAGIIEGEGCISYSSTPKIMVKMADKDVIEKVASLFNRNITISKQQSDWKEMYAVGIYGTPAIEWMFTIYSLMGIRRKHKIVEVVNLWKERKEKHSKYSFSCGHPKITSNFRYSGKYVRCRTCALTIGG